MSDAASAPLRAAEFVRTRRYGVLATHSGAVPGYPFGSVVPYVLVDGALAIQISDIAEHTRNLTADGHCSLTIFDPADADDPQAGPRLTWIADARRASDDHAVAAAERYFRYFPAARSYERTHDFAFWLLQPVRIRLIGGFGDIRWLRPAELPLRNPLPAHEADAVAHMNDDHGDALTLLCRQHTGVTPDAVRLVGLDGYGMDLLVDGQALRIPYPRPLGDAAGLRTLMMEMVQAAREA